MRCLVFETVDSSVRQIIGEPEGPEILIIVSFAPPGVAVVPTKAVDEDHVDLRGGSSVTDAV
jgi:hypothetical protein